MLPFTELKSSLSSCPEEWAYVGTNCHLPLCDAGGCEEGAPLREYVKCRLNNVRPAFAQNWTGGDIFFFGDSNTDIATAYNIFPIVPRGFNGGVLGARLCDVTVCVGMVQSWIDALEAANTGVNFAPSSVVVMAGTNDLMRDVNGVENSFTPATAAQYRLLFERLKVFRQANGNCGVIIRSVLPGVPGYPGCCSDPYVPNEKDFNRAVRQANAFLGPLCDEFDFTFLNDYADYWNDETDDVKKKLYRGGLYYNPCVEKDGSDYLHLGCQGQRVALMNVARLAYEKGSSNAGTISSLSNPPFGPPQVSSVGPDPSMAYRYLRRKVEPGERLTLKITGSTYNYAAVNKPGQVGGMPVSEMLKADGTAAEVQYENVDNYDAMMVLCLGTDPDGAGQFEVRVS